MSSKLRVIPKVSWLMMIPILAIITGFVLAASAMFDVLYGLVGGLVPVVLAQVLRRTVVRQQYLAVKLMNKDMYKQALPYCEKALAFIERHPWVDRYRWVALMSPTKVSYREMAMSNLAGCYMQVGEAKKAIELWEKMQQEFPGSEFAARALRFVESMKKMEQVQVEAQSGEGEG